MLPPERRGGIVDQTPGSAGGIPITPRNGASSTLVPRSSLAVRKAVSIRQWNGSPSPNVTPHGPGRTSSTRTASV